MIWILHLVPFVVKVPKVVTTRKLNYSPKRAKKKVNKRRKVVRHLRKKYVDSIEDKEGVSYASGGL